MTEIGDKKIRKASLYISFYMDISNYIKIGLGRTEKILNKARFRVREHEDHKYHRKMLAKIIQEQKKKKINAKTNLL